MNRHLAAVLRHLHPTRSGGDGGDGLPVDELRAGVIGLDGDGATVTRLLNTTRGDSRCRVVASSIGTIGRTGIPLKRRTAPRTPRRCAPAPLSLHYFSNSSRSDFLNSQCDSHTL